jgi:hypothetical protein
MRLPHTPRAKAVRHHNLAMWAWQSKVYSTNKNNAAGMTERGWWVLKEVLVHVSDNYFPGRWARVA